MKVWTIFNNGKGEEELFTDDQEGINYAKQRSARAMCCFSANSKKQFQCYEHGEITTARRKQELSKQVEEILVTEMAREYKRYGGRRTVKKQQ